LCAICALILSIAAFVWFRLGDDTPVVAREAVSASAPAMSQDKPSPPPPAARSHARAPHLQEEAELPDAASSHGQRLLDSAVTLATREERDPQQPASTIKSRLLRTDFKYPHVRCDERWEETPGGIRLARRDLYVADHVMVRFPAEMTPAEVAAWCETRQFKLRRRLQSEPVYLVATPSAELGSTTHLLESVRKSFPTDASGALAERDFLVFPTVTPNDSSYNQLWGLHNTGQSAGTVDADIDAPEAWEFSTGSADVLVAVIDTGVDYNHLDLRDNIWANPGEIAGNGIDDDGNGFIDDQRGWDFYANDNNPFDETGHGTHCAGTIGATGNNNLGVTGVCWDVSIIPVRFLGPSGGSTSDAIEAVNYSTALGVDLSSNSWGGGSFSSLLESAIASANTAGILFVAAAGNDSVNNDSGPHYPSSYSGSNVIAVASTTASDTLSGFSNYGRTSVDLAAPGSSIYSTLPGNLYTSYSGTSMATPHVSGALALLRAMAPELDHLQLKQHLLANVDPLPALASITSTGGRLNLAKAAMLLAGPRIVPTTARIDLTGGNGDAFLNPGEQGTFVFEFRNIGSETATQLSGVLTADATYPGILLSGNSLTIGNLAAGANSAEFRIPFTVGAAVATPTQAGFTLTVTDAAQDSWVSHHPLEVHTSSTVSGRVTSVADGQPVTTALVSWSGPVSGSVNVDASGGFSFVAIDGTYSVNAAAPGFVSLASVAVTTPPTPAPLEIRLGVPDLVVSPLALNESVFAGSTSTTTVTLENRGTAPLSWTAIVNSSPNATMMAPGGRHAPAGTLLDLTGKSVGNIGSTWNLLPHLTSRGATIVTLSFPLANDDLDGIDVLIIDDAIVAATAPDVARIRAWVSQGGGLFLTADNLASMGNVNAILQGSGIQETSLNSFYTETITTILPHPSTADVTSLSLTSYGAQCTLTDGALPLMQDASARTLGGAVTMGAGRMIAFGNEIDASISTSGGLLFANQAVDWLSKTVGWLSIADGTGVLAPGETVTLTLQFAAAYLNAGVMTGEIIVLSNEPGNPRTVIPVSLTVVGSPAIAADSGSLNFPDTYVRGSSSLDLTLENPGTDVLTISSLAFSNPTYRTSLICPVDVLPGNKIVVPVRFSPAATGAFPATLTITSNSPVNPSLAVILAGQGVAGPELGLSPQAFALSLPLGARQTVPLVISNTGDTALTWSLDLEAPPVATASNDPLQDLLDRLNADFTAITSLIPNRFDFTDGVTGTYISDGGNDMYDSGNYLATNANPSFIAYSDNKITANSASLGANGRYFTRKHPGLFVFAADLDGVSTFNISGGLGADGSGSVSAAVLHHSMGGRNYAGYVKRVHGAGDPSVNHLLIVENQPAIGRTFASDTNSDAHSLTGLSNSTRLYYLLFASTNGGLVSDAQCAAIMEAFLGYVTPSLPWLDFDTVAGLVPPDSQQTSQLIFDATAVSPGQYGATIVLSSNDPGNAESSIPVSLTVTSAPVIEVTPLPLAFANVPVNTAYQLPVEVRNTGDLPLILTGASIAGGASFSVSPPDTSVLGPGGLTRLYVLFAPTTPGTHTGTLNILSNSPVAPVLGIPISGSAVAAGVLRSNPKSLSLTLESGHTGSLPLTLQNNASQAVTWTTSARSSSDLATTNLAGLSVAVVGYSTSDLTAVRSTLEGLGATTQFLNYTSITQAALQPFDVAVFDYNIESLGTLQLTELSAWLASGGSVVVHSSSSSYSDQNTLFASYGINLAYSYGTSAWTPAGNHFLTAGISQVTHGTSYNKITASGAAVPLLVDSSGFATAAISEVNGSRVAVLTAAITSFTGDNLIFFGRLAGWAGDKAAWLSQTPASGTMAALGSAQTSVNFDARDLLAGSYAAELQIRTAANKLIVPVRLQVTGTPDIAIPTPLVQFPLTHVGYANQNKLRVVNQGSSPLTIESIAVPHPDLATLTPLPAVIAPRSSLEIIIEFRPGSVLQLAGNLILTSDDPDTPVISLPVAGSSAGAPAGNAPASLAITAIAGQTATLPFLIGNTGGSDLVWSLEFGSPALDTPLEAVLPALDASATAITGLIPGKYDFTDGITGNYISDGGGDMYDSGNQLATNLAPSTYLNYSNGIISPAAATFGPAGRYFTRKYDGLFVLAADLDGVGSFRIGGGLGADGSGSLDGAELALTHRGIHWRGFVKRVHGVSEPSVNHLIIVADQPGLAHAFPNDTNVDTHEVTGLAGSRRLYYLLYAGANGGYIDDAATTAVMRGFLDSIAEAAPWLAADPPAGATPPASSSQVTMTADATHLYAGTYQTLLNLGLNDPVRPTLAIPVTLTVTGSPEILADPGVLLFPPAIVGSSQTLDLTLLNPGTAVLTVTGVQLGGRFSTHQTFPVHVPPGESVKLPVTYTPGLYQFEAGIAVISSDAVNLPTTIVNLYGIGLPPPVAAIDRTEISVSIGGSSSRHEELTLANSGKSNLHWSAGIDYGQALPLYDRLDLSGLTIRLVSESSTATRFTTLASELTRLGAEVSEIYYSDFKPALLATTDVLLLDYSTNYLTASDLQAINDWTYNGGGLLVTDPSSSPTDFNTILQGSGLQFENTGYNTTTAVTDIRYDITTVGVVSLDAGGSTYCRLLASGNARPLARWSTGNHYAGIGKLGSGRAIGACGDLAYNSDVSKAGNLRFLTNSIAWLAGRVRDWVEPVPASGISGVNSTAALAFAFDSTGLVPGTYHADAVIATDDPSHPEIRIPLTLEVTSAPEIAANSSALAFDPTIVGLSSARSIVLQNTGHGILTISSADKPADFLIGMNFPVVLDPGKTVSLSLTFAPQAAGVRDGTLIIRSNALNQPQLAIPLTGYGLAAPTLTLTPPQVQVATTPNTRIDQVLAIGNSGPGHLSWSVTDLFATARPLTYPPGLAGIKAGFLTSTSSYSGMRSKLTGYGCSIVNLTAPVQQATLNAINVLVVDDSLGSSLTATDYTLIRAWVESGGSLLLTAESTAVLQPLLAGTGISPFYYYRSGSPATTPSPHPVTTGVTAVYPYYPEAHFTVTGDAVRLLSFATGEAYAAASRLARGNLIAIGNEAFGDNDFTTGDGERFAVQCLTWLTNRLPWLGLAGSAGSIPPGGSNEIMITLDATGLALGTYRGTLRLSSNDPAKLTPDIPITFVVSATPATADFAQWQLDHLSGPSGERCGFSDDWNRDGLANGIEYYFAIDPAGPRNHGHLPAIGRDNGGMFYRYTRLTSLGDNLMRIKHSPDLVTWTDLSAAGLKPTVTSATNGDGTTTVEIRFVPGSGRGFFTFDLSSP
jgi:subtilisin family serine protease